MQRIRNMMIASLIVFNGMLLVCMTRQSDKNFKTFYPQSLSDFSKTGKSFGAGVMPYYEGKDGEKYILLGREVNSRAHEWALFSGGSEQSATVKNEMEHPLDCATREFYEEAVLQKTLGWDEAATKEYITKNTTEIVARYSRDVRKSRPLIIYQVKFTKKDIETIIGKFKNLFDDETLDKKFKEKDALALVKYQDLIDAVKKDEPWVTLDAKLPSWFSKTEQEKICLFSMPYRLLRARHASEAIFTVSGKKYHYVQDPLSTKKEKQNVFFFAEELVKNNLRSKL